MLDHIAPSEFRIGHDILLVDNFTIPDSLYAPFKIDEVLAVFCKKGVLDVTVNNRRYTAKAPCLFQVVDDQSFQFHQSGTSPLVTCLLLSRHFTDQFMSDLSNTGQLYASLLERPLIQFHEEETATLETYLSLVRKTLAHLDNPYRMDSVRHLFVSMSLNIIIALRNTDSLVPSSRANEILFQFLGLLSENFRQERGIKFYADKMCYTDKYLSRVVRCVSGRTVHDWVDEYVGNEAKVLLDSTNKSISSIAEELHFASPSLFCKYFKRVFGITPQSFRKTL